MPDVERLSNVMRQDFQALQKDRSRRMSYIKQYVGSRYSEFQSIAKVPINKIAEMVNVFARSVVANHPKAMITTMVPELKHWARTFELAMNRRIEEMELGPTVRTIFVDGVFAMGIVKVGLERDQDRLYVPEGGGDPIAVGVTFVDRVDLDDFVYDMRPGKFNETEYVAHRIRIEFEFAMDSGLYDKKLIEELGPTRRSTINDDGGEKAENLSTGAYTDQDEYTDKIELWEVYRRGPNDVVTLGGAGSKELTTEAVREEPWEGPSHGPYRILGFGDVPGNIMPSSPIDHVFDLHLLINSLFRKAEGQARAQKKVGMFSGGSDKDATRLNAVEDGSWARVDNPAGTSQVELGGVSESTLLMFIQAMGQFDQRAGNLSLLAGISPAAKTLGQEEILEGNASKLIADLTDKTVTFTRGILQDVAHYLWQEPLANIRVQKRITATESIDSVFSPELRQGRFPQYEIKIHPFSMQHQTPNSKLQSIISYMQNIGQPFMQLMAQQGLTFDFEGLTRTWGKLSNIEEEMLDFLVSMNPQNSFQQLTSQSDSGRPPVTRTINERVNTPGVTQQGQDQILSQMLAGSNLQPSQRGSLLGV